MDNFEVCNTQAISGVPVVLDRIVRSEGTGTSVMVKGWHANAIQATIATACLPVSERAMMAHLFPCSLCACGRDPGVLLVGLHRCSSIHGVLRTAIILASSSSLKGSFFTQGLSWLHHLKRHDLPLRPRIP